MHLLTQRLLVLGQLGGLQPHTDHPFPLDVPRNSPDAVPSTNANRSGKRDLLLRISQTRVVLPRNVTIHFRSS